MEISLRNLPDDGLKINGVISAEKLNARMNESGTNTVQFLNGPQVELTVYPVLGGAEITGTVKASYSQPCSRCMEQLNAELDVKIEVAIKQKIAAIDEAEMNAEPGIIFVEGDNLNIEEYLQESLILALPFTGPDHPNCSWNKVKKAPVNQAATQSLGDLLKKAGVK